MLLTMGAIAAGGVELWNHPPNWVGNLDATQIPLPLPRGHGGQLSAFEEMMVRRPKSTMGNSNVVELTKANVRPDVIVRLIRASNADYDLRANSVIELKNAGVDETVILAMIDQSYTAR